MSDVFTLQEMVNKDPAFVNFSYTETHSARGMIKAPGTAEIKLNRPIMMSLTDVGHESEYWIMKAFSKLHMKHYANYYSDFEEVILEIHEHNVDYFIAFLKEEVANPILASLGT